jgi:cytochrome oxidase Cu insertion factor (SCO1/SenC/PrrC family)
MNNKNGGRAMVIDFQRGFAAILTLGLLFATVGIAQVTQSAKKSGARETKVLQLGTKAPDFTLPDSTGEKRSPTDFRGKKHIALVFYPALFRAGG